MAHAMRGLEVFRFGRLKGKTYSPDRDGRDLRTNFQRFSTGPKPLHVPSVVVGHEEEDLRDTRIPRLGDVTDLTADGGKVKVNLESIEPALVQAIKGGKLDSVSAEIYDEPPEGLFENRAAILQELKDRGRDPVADLKDARAWASREHERQVAKTFAEHGDPDEVHDYEYLVDLGLRRKLGKMFRRLAFLGGDIAHVKGLNQEGLTSKLATFSERRPRIRITRVSCRRGAYTVFSEDVPMQREEMIKALVAAGMPEEVVNSMDDMQLEAVLKVTQGGGEQPAEGTEPPPTEEPAPEGDEPPVEGDDAGATAEEGDEGQGNEPPPEEEGDDKEKPNEFDEGMGDDKDAAMSSFGEMCKKYSDAYRRKFGEDLPPLDQKKPATASGPATPFSEGAMEKLITRVVNKVVGPVRQQVSATAADAKRQRVTTFCEEQVRKGRINPAEMDETAGPTLVDRLLKLDAVQKVHKFSENGKEKSLTALDAELRAIQQRAPLYKGEKIKDSKTGAVKFAESSGQEARKERVKKFAEGKGRTVLAKIGMDKDAYLKAWEAADEKAREELESIIVDD
jgi:hypothetical protein